MKLTRELLRLLPRAPRPRGRAGRSDGWGDWPTRQSRFAPFRGATAAAVKGWIRRVQQRIGAPPPGARWRVLCQGQTCLLALETRLGVVAHDFYLAQAKAELGQLLRQKG